MRDYGSMKTNVLLRYEGPALDTGRMDVYEASANMIAFSEFMVAVVKTTCGDDAEATAQVAGFQRGSFVTELAFNVGAAATIFTALTPEQLWSIVKDAFAVWKHLKGQPPREVTHNSGQQVSVTNNSGNIIQVQTPALTLVLSERGTTPVGKFVREALGRDGINKLQIQDDDETPIVEVDRSEAAYFVPVAAETIVSDNTNRMLVSLVSPVFQDGNKWRFNDGSYTFSAAILDDAFISSVNAGERFGKGDVLDVDMQIVQQRSGLKVSVERRVLKVYEHLTPHEQLKILPA